MGGASLAALQAFQNQVLSTLAVLSFTVGHPIKLEVAASYMSKNVRGMHGEQSIVLL